MVNQADGRFQTPLHHALEHEAESFAQLLLTRGADVNAWDSLGRTPLHVCMEKQNNSMLLTVLAWNPSLDVLSGPGWNVIIYACRHNLLPAFLEVLKEAPEALKLASNFQDR